MQCCYCEDPKSWRKKSPNPQRLYLILYFIHFNVLFLKKNFQKKVAVSQINVSISQPLLLFLLFSVNLDVDKSLREHSTFYLELLLTELTAFLSFLVITPETEQFVLIINAGTCSSKA